MAHHDSAQNIHVLVADHDPVGLERTCRRVLAEGCEVSTARKAHGLSERVARLSPDLVLVDVLMPGLHGEELFLLLARCRPPTPPAVVIHTRVMPGLLRTVVDMRDVLGFIRSTVDEREFSEKFRTIARRLQMPRVDLRRAPSRSGTHAKTPVSTFIKPGPGRKLG